MRFVLVGLMADVKHLARGYRTVSLARCLSKAGHDVDLVSSTPAACVSRESFGRLIGVPYARFRTGEKGSTLARFVNRLASWPEPERRWVAPVMTRLDDVFGEAKPDALVVSSPPHSTQLIGILSARRYGVSYIADLRDDWLTNHRHRWHTPLHKRVAAHYERVMVETADRVVLNTSIVEGRFRARYPRHEAKFTTITNGYNEEDFAQPGEIDLKRDGRKIIAYTGDMYDGFLYARFTEMVDELKRAGLARQWRLVTAGSDVPLRMEQKDVWTHLGLLRPNAVAALLDRADLLVTLMPPGERTPSGTVPLKIYSYLRSGKPIVYFGESGSTTAVLSGFSGTFAKSRAQWPGFVAWLRATPLAGTYARDGVEEYSFQSLAARLAAITERVIATREPYCAHEDSARHPQH